MTLEEALTIGAAIQEGNGGNPWPPDEVAKKCKVSSKTDKFFYLAKAANDYGITSGGRGSDEIGLTELGRENSGKQPSIKTFQH